MIKLNELGITFSLILSLLISVYIELEFNSISELFTRYLRGIMAAVDYLSNHTDVDPEKIGVIGICGFGGFGLNAAACDPRIKAATAVSVRPFSEAYINDAQPALSLALTSAPCLSKSATISL